MTNPTTTFYTIQKVIRGRTFYLWLADDDPSAISVAAENCLPGEIVTNGYDTWTTHCTLSNLGTYHEYFLGRVQGTGGVIVEYRLTQED